MSHMCPCCKRSLLPREVVNLTGKPLTVSVQADRIEISESADTLAGVPVADLYKPVEGGRE